MIEQLNATSSQNTPVTVIGLGPMGQAMTRTLLDSGHPVTVWNRTAARADGVVTDGATLAPTPREAVEASDLVILSLTDYQAMYDILGTATASLAGRTLVNLSSDTPDRTREAATWAAGHGAGFLTGGVMVPAPMVGTDAAHVYYSGREQVMETHRAVLAPLGTPRYLGDDPGLAQMMYQAQLAVFLTSLSALMHATAMLGTAGLKASEALPELLSFTDSIGDMLRAGDKQLGVALDAGEHPGDLSTVTMMGATSDHIVETSTSLGLDLALPLAVQAHYRRAIENGHGGDNWTRIIDSIRKQQ
ncbi:MULTISPECIES: NAD(P)-binding domain-containing protein [unclassified Streptomyces]|uniref:NAD(P)-dependent oxidoreductase n=1 Tax=unclassified Streptomyces TaxID=2593676 RepID=UPI000F509798|nr:MULTISPECIES: NAD(P)-binding domain-containing protein [unclassified Streptomyces]MDH6455259.1 3-hydroxyisobutyrate dehydrogenase-like beta-hydroxyacid dehydrogenase [Streptomyces sp. SAI-119]MDH6494188.1 3-hydroxyisobutyrate dehydrogenase-like beta-hydroxyacid dehydrogenase [Streptomyces sp. SAI-149]QUC58630.1 NAD(P)-dependent oxidoreductase [Streptomyces sp. A2-16]